MPKCSYHKCAKSLCFFGTFVGTSTLNNLLKSNFFTTGIIYWGNIRTIQGRAIYAGLLHVRGTIAVHTICTCRCLKCPKSDFGWALPSPNALYFAINEIDKFWQIHRKKYLWKLWKQKSDWQGRGWSKALWIELFWTLRNRIPTLKQNMSRQGNLFG